MQEEGSSSHSGGVGGSVDAADAPPMKVSEDDEAEEGPGPQGDRAGAEAVSASQSALGAGARNSSRVTLGFLVLVAVFSLFGGLVGWTAGRRA